MCNVARRLVSVLSVVLFLPAAAFAQAAITGVVRDTSGAVLPGVTVEAASPVLIERTRSVVSDDTGQYRIVDLRPGTYAVTFSLPGFNTVKREGIELSGDFVATVSAELRVGALEETVTVTGESPIVDVQSTRVQNDRGQRGPGGDPLLAGRDRDPVPGAGHEQQRRRRRHHRRDRRYGRLHSRRPRLRFANAPRRHQHRLGRRELERGHLQRRGLAGNRPDAHREDWAKPRPRARR